MKLRLLCVAVLLLFVSTSAFCQKGTGGIINMPSPTQGSDLQLRIAWSNDRMLEESVHVQLLNSTNIPIMDSFSTHDGTLTFHAVQAGSYRLKIDGAQIKDTVTDFFVISPQDHMHTEWVHVSPKDEPDIKGLGNAPTVSASELNAPPKAVSELDKGLDAFGKGDLKKAEEHLRKAVEIYPKFARAWNNLGVILMRGGDKAGAREAWTNAVNADGKFASGYLNLARLEMLDNKYPAAEADVQKVLATDANNAEALSLLSREEFLSGQYDKALFTARKVHTLPHDHLADVHLIAGDVLLKQNQNVEAMKEYDLYLKEYPDSPKAVQVRAAMAQIQAKESLAKPN